MGSPTMNMLPVEVRGGAAWLDGDRKLAFPGLAYIGPADLGVRPEDVTLCGAKTRDALQARVLLVEELGEARIVRAELPGERAVAVRCAATGKAPKRGETVGLRLDHDRLHLFGPDGARLDAETTEASE